MVLSEWGISEINGLNKTGAKLLPMEYLHLDKNTGQFIFTIY